VYLLPTLGVDYTTIHNKVGVIGSLILRFRRFRLDVSGLVSEHVSCREALIEVGRPVAFIGLF